MIRLERFFLRLGQVTELARREKENNGLSSITLRAQPSPPFSSFSLPLLALPRRLAPSPPSPPASPSWPPSSPRSAGPPGPGAGRRRARRGHRGGPTRRSSPVLGRVFFFEEIKAREVSFFLFFPFLNEATKKTIKRKTSKRRRALGVNLCIALSVAFNAGKRGSQKAPL